MSAELAALKPQRDAIAKFRKQSADFLAGMETALVSAVDRLSLLCEECGIQTQHPKEAHPECPKCQKKFANSKSLATHVLKCKAVHALNEIQPAPSMKTNPRPQ